ncbi:hypothetical protein WBJ53_23460 [Spirosoma sp. SC4-14]|uniref:hypothetical protein n=1 Tax=Spirosoma sp. SC4-14 TaxID=3128900 RepID=UPI0030CAC411
MVDNATSVKSLKRIHELLESPLFRENSSDDAPWKSAFAELIMLVNDLLVEENAVGHRVSFYEGVGVNGKIQDITSLVDWLHSYLPGSPADLTARLAYQGYYHRLNRYFGRGTGYFANGLFFTSDYDDDVAFFLDDQRIYLNHHISRAVDEAEHHLLP